MPDPLWAASVPTYAAPPDANVTEAQVTGPNVTEAQVTGPNVAGPGADDDVATAAYAVVPVAGAEPPVDPTWGVSTRAAPTIAAGVAADRRRRRTVMVVVAFIVAAAAAVTVSFALTRDSESAVSPDSAVDPALTTSQPGDSSAPIGSSSTATTSESIATTADPATTVPAAIATLPAPAPTVAPTTVLTATSTSAAASSPPATSTTASTATVPATSAAAPVVTPAPSAAPTTASATNSTATTSASTAPSGTISPSTNPSPSEGDLDLSRPISRPACDGQYITLIGASVDSQRYATQVQGLLSRYPGSKYLKTELVCSSLRARAADGTPIYIGFFGPFSSKAAACAARADGPDDSYVKSLDNTSDPSASVDC